MVIGRRGKSGAAPTPNVVEGSVRCELGADALLRVEDEGGARD